MRAWTSGQTWGGPFQHELDLLMSGLKETENPGVPCEQSSRLGEPLQPRDLRLTRLSGKFTARFSSEAAGFPDPQSRHTQARRHTTWPSPHRPGPPGNQHCSRALSTRLFSQLLWKPNVWPNTLCACLYVYMCTTHRSHKTGAGNSNAHSGQASHVRVLGGNAEGWGLWQ